MFVFHRTQNFIVCKSLAAVTIFKERWEWQGCAKIDKTLEIKKVLKVNKV